jgi:hypothetical protein
MTPSPVKSILVLFKQFGLTLALGLFLLGSAAAANLHPVRGFPARSALFPASRWFQNTHPG